MTDSQTETYIEEDEAPVTDPEPATEDVTEHAVEVTDTTPAPKKRGRKPGSKNKPKEGAAPVDKRILRKRHETKAPKEPKVVKDPIDVSDNADFLKYEQLVTLRTEAQSEVELLTRDIGETLNKIAADFGPGQPLVLPDGSTVTVRANKWGHYLRKV
jgi:hypothetical protein